MDRKITTDNVFEVNVPKLANDKNRFGSLVFEKAGTQLEIAQKWLKEAHDLKYEELFPPDQTRLISRNLGRLVEYLEWLRIFDIGGVSNPKAEHDSFNNRVEGFYNELFSNLSIPLLPFLRDARRRERPEEKKIDEEVKQITQLRVELQSELEKVRKETEKIRITGKDVTTAKGERATVKMAIHFSSETLRYSEIARRWLIGVIVGYVAVFTTLICLGIETGTNVKLLTDAPMMVDRWVVWGEIVSRLVILAALWYGLSFVVKNYYVNSQLAAVNRHRAAVARTLEDFIAVEQQQEKPRLSEMLQNAADSMFKHAPIGFVSKTEKENTQPILQVVNDLMGLRNPG